MMYMFLRSIRVYDNVIHIDIHENTNVWGEDVIHQSLVGHTTIAITHLHYFANHGAIRGGKQGMWNMFMVNLDLLICIFPIN